MAEAELTIKYQPIWVYLLNKISIVIIPLLLIFFLWTFLALFHAVEQHSIARNGAMLVLFIELIIIIFTAFVYIVSSDNEIYIGRDGIFFPLLLAPSFSTKSRYSWEALKKVQYTAKEGQLGVLTLVFNNRFPVRLNLNKLNEEETDKLIVAIDVWGGGADNFPQLLEIRSVLKGEGQDEGVLSYTDIWEDELSRRFGATNFVPLEPKDTVSNEKYTVIRQIAFGGMSAIYLVKDGDDKQYILKESVVPEEGNLVLKEKAEQMLAREAKLLSSIDHPRIAKVFDHFKENQRDYLLIEHLTGQDLRRVIKENGAQEESRVIEWAQQIASILKYLHDLNPPIIHKDLTPSNLILESDNLISLIDFGAANQFVGTATGTIIGKQSYIAPEQLRGKARIESDIYSFGCTLFYLSTSMDPEPISPSNPNKLLKKKLSSQLNELIHSCTEMEIEDRPSSMDQIIESLSALNREA